MPGNRPAVTLRPTTRPGLGSGLARCPTATPAENNVPVQTTTGSEYCFPSRETQRILPIHPPPPASVMHRCRDLRFPPISHSHAIHAAKKDAAKIASAGRSSSMQSSSMNATHLHISADKRLETCSTTTGENFQPAAHMLPAALIRQSAAEASKFTHFCTAEDPSDTMRHPPTAGYTIKRREKYVVTKNAGCCPLTGSRGLVQQQSGTTTNCATYRGHTGRCGQELRSHVRHPQQLSNIPHGDPDKVDVACTTNSATYKAPQPDSTQSHPATVSATFQSSVHLGDTTHIIPPSTTAREMFPRPPQEGPGARGQEAIKRVHRNASFLPCGDLNADRVRKRMTHSTTRSSHRVPPTDSYPALVDSSRLHTASSIYLGHHHLPSSSTMTSSYLPLTAQPHRVGAPSRDNIPFDYYPGHLSDSTAASSYRTHTGDLRHSLPPNTLKNLKTSHWQLSNNHRYTQ